MKALLFVALFFASINHLFAQDKAVEFSTFQLSDTVYMLKGRGGNIGISTGEDGLYIIDDQLRPITDQLLKAIRKISNKPIRFVINTHYHADHVGGNETIGNAGAVLIAHENIRKRMTTEQVSIFMNNTTPPYPKGALPVVTFNDRLSLHLNGETATAYYVANGHTDGDSIIHFPVSNVIHMGDMFFNGLYPYVDLDAGGSMQGLVAAANLALSMADESTRIIPGHGPLGMTEDLKNYRDYLVQAGANVQTLIDEGMDLVQIIAAEPTREWDESLGKTWITPAQFVTFIYNSLKGIQHYTPLPVEETEEG
ncbi:MAG: MBL fold metallo-hydrolase [Xanthomonadales bacterium]|nr:MBL fold metallo-hydrolase [Xanthomonadales bacterium]